MAPGVGQSPPAAKKPLQMMLLFETTAPLYAEIGTARAASGRPCGAGTFTAVISHRSARPRSRGTGSTPRSVCSNIRPPALPDRQ